MTTEGNVIPNSTVTTVPVQSTEIKVNEEVKKQETTEVKVVNQSQAEGVKPLEEAKLYSSFSFWFKVIDDNHQSNKNQTMKEEDYTDMVKKIADFKTIEEFWDVYQYLKKPESSKHGLEISVFKSHIKPMWEDDYNKSGGKVSLKIKKEYSNLIWDEMVYRLIGNNFPDINNDEINGLVFSIKRDSNFIQVWFRNFSTNGMNDITASVKKILSIPDGVELDIRPFNKSKDIASVNLAPNNMKDNKQYRKY